MSPIPPTTVAAPRIRLRNFTSLTKFASNNRGALIAGISCCIGVAAVVEDSSCLPQLQELGVGLQGAVYAGGVVCLVLALGWVDERFEGVYGRVWRCVKHRVFGQDRDEGDGEVEVTMMFDGEGRSVYLLDEEGPESEVGSEQKQKQKQKGPAALMRERRSGGEAVAVESTMDTTPGNTSSWDTPGRMPNLKPPPRPLYRTSKPSISPSQANRVPKLPSVHYSPPPPEDYHASGLLGPSPVPERYAAPGWKHFTGEGFWRRQQEIDDVNRMAHLGKSKVGVE